MLHHARTMWGCLSRVTQRYHLSPIPRHPGDPGVCQEGESILSPHSSLLIYHANERSEIRSCQDLQIKTIQKVLPQTRAGAVLKALQMLPSLIFFFFFCKLRCSWCQTSLAGRTTMAGSLGTAVMTHIETSALGLLNPDGRPLRSCPVSSTKNCMALELEACLDSISLTLCRHHSRLTN